jgi:hypothetical protein
MDNVNPDNTKIAGMEIYETPNGVRAYCVIGDEPGEWFDVPPHMAAQIPMAIRMMKQQMS